MTDPNPEPRPDVVGEFTLVGVLGEGGSGTVYDARWGHRQVALKVMRAELPASERDRFLAEARLLMEITHPGVVKVLAAGTLPEGRPYLAMELLRGEALATRLSRAAVPLPDAIAFFVQLADAVSAMHARGLLHRDLKPENVMLVSDGAREHAVLLDFGIARAMDRGEVAPTQTGIVRGTPAYMAPERFFGQPATIGTDVYELAVTLFAMIAGRLPWADCIDPEVRLNPARLADLAAVPPALDGELARALSTRAANRPPTVAAL
ncbi:MAG TPA: serine/threonine-protein kinase, partial [Kofleriaceae bacterium]|nr:serine/threonine-protein kinase [Kofleriaceae bacterium]